MKVEYYTSIKDNLHFLVFDTFNRVYNWNLANNEVKVLAELYNKDYELLKSVKSYDARMTILFSKETKKEIYTKLGMPYNSFNNNLTTLRKKGIIEDNKISERYIMDLTKKEFNINLVVINDDTRG